MVSVNEKYGKSPLNDIAITDMINQLSKSDLSYFTAIFLVIKAIAIFCLFKIWKDNQDYQNLYNKHLAQIGQAQTDQNNINV